MGCALDAALNLLLQVVFRMLQIVRLRLATIVCIDHLRCWDVKFDSPSAYFCYQTS